MVVEPATVVEPAEAVVQHLVQVAAPGVVTVREELLLDAAEALDFVQVAGDGGPPVAVADQQVPLFAQEQVGMAPSLLSEAEAIEVGEDAFRRSLYTESMNSRMACASSRGL